MIIAKKQLVVALFNCKDDCCKMLCGGWVDYIILLIEGQHNL